MGVLRNLEEVELADHVTKTNREYRDGNMRWWRQRLKDRFGVNIPEPTKEDDAVGHSVKVGSPEHHYHYPKQTSGVPDWLKAVALIGLGGLVGVAGWQLWKDRDGATRSESTPADKPDSTIGLKPGGLNIEIVKDVPPE